LGEGFIFIITNKLLLLLLLLFFGESRRGRWGGEKRGDVTPTAIPITPLYCAHLSAAQTKECGAKGAC